MCGNVPIISCCRYKSPGKAVERLHKGIIIWQMSAYQAFARQSLLRTIPVFCAQARFLCSFFVIATMASASGANFVKYFFYAGNTISKQRKQSLVALAYATAQDKQLAPQAILIRYACLYNPGHPGFTLQYLDSMY